VRAISETAVRSGESFEYQARILRPDGEVRHYHSRGTVLRDASDRPSRLVGVVQDATERVRAEEAARRQADAIVEQAELLEQTHDAVIVRGLDGAIQYWNRGAEDLYGWSRTDAIGQVIHSLLQTQFPDTLAAVEAALEAVSRWEGELIHTHRDGSQIVVECRKVLVRDPQGRPLKVLEINRDITQRRTLERQQQELSAMVAHELMRPVTGIELYAELFQMVGAYRAEWAIAIRQSARQLGRLVGDLVDASKLQTQYLKLRVEPTHLPEVVRAQTEAVQLSSPSHHLRVESPDSLPLGHWDRGRIEQICHNLLSNAIKYSSEGSEVMVRVADLGTEARVSVQDQGVGIAPEAIPHVFERFYRAHATEERAGGLGLGLSITKAFVEAHGGALTVESVLGQGSTFSFTLPYRGPASAEEEAHADGAARPSR
jgi:two-component system CheB/CheR fusion protein